MKDIEILIHGNEGYKVTVTFNTVFEKLKTISFKYPKCVIVTDSNVDVLWGEKIRANVSQATAIVIPGEGEKIKSFDSLLNLYNAFSDAGLDRHGAVIAIGGGTIGDLAGFAASTYMRGVDFINIPTTLLAMVDSSIGGKTGIDLTGAKNAVGSFFRPREVITDTTFLSTLPKKEFENGMGEILKYSLISDTELMETLENDNFDISDVIERCINIKKYYVEKDEFDKGIRMVLNLGHTLGHAFESVSGYKYSHGECVVLGCLGILHACEHNGWTEKGLFDRFLSLCQKRSTIITEVFDLNEIYNAILRDKKKNGDVIRFVYPKQIGDVHILNFKKENIMSFLNDVFYGYDF